MNKSKLFFIITAVVFLIATACNGGSFVDPGMLDSTGDGGSFGGGGGGGLGSLNGLGGDTTPGTFAGASTNGKMYTLKITKKNKNLIRAASFDPEEGDDYELTEGEVSMSPGSSSGTGLRSTGTVKYYINGKFTLQPSTGTATFEGTVSGGTLSSLNGPIKWDNGGTFNADLKLTVDVTVAEGWPPSKYLSAFGIGGLTISGAKDTWWAYVGGMSIDQYKTKYSGLIISYTGAKGNGNTINNWLSRNGWKDYYTAMGGPSEYSDYLKDLGMFIKGSNKNMGTRGFTYCMNFFDDDYGDGMLAVIRFD